MTPPEPAQSRAADMSVDGTEPGGRRMLRYEVPIDDEWHEIVAGEALHVDCRQFTTVEFWALEGTEFTQTLRVFGTGHPLPNEPLRHVGTALSPFAPERQTMRGTPRGELVWHLFRKEPF